MEEPARVAAGPPVVEVRGHFHDAEAGASGVDRHPGLEAEAGGKRAASFERLPRHDALTGERLRRVEVGQSPDCGTARVLHEAESPSLRREDRDREIRPVTG